MNINNFPVVMIQPGHHMFHAYQTETGEYIFSIEVSENAHEPGKHTDEELGNETIMPVFMMVIHSPEQAEIMGNYLMELSQHMKADQKSALPKQDETKVNKEHMTIREYNKLFGGNNND